MKFFKKILVLLFLTATISLSAQTKVVCILGDTVALNLSGTRGDIQWQISNDSLTWTDLVGQHSEQLEFISSLPTQWVRASITENNCPVFYENAIFINAIDTTLSDFDPLIIVMDTVTVQFMPDSVQQTLGTYNFVVTGSNANIDPGDILIGTEGRGFLVSVDYLIRSNNQLLIQTHRANLDDLFDDASFDLEMLIDSLEQRDFGVQLALNNLQIVNDGNISFSFPSLNYQLTGASHWASLYSAAQGVEQFTMQCDYGLTLGGEMRLVPSSPGASSDEEGSYSIAIYNETKEVDVNGKPVLYTTQVDLKIDYILVQWGTSCELNSSFSSQSNIGYDLSYTPANFYDVFSFDGSPGADYSFFSNEDNCNLTPEYAHYVVTFKTLVSSYFYDQRFLEVDISNKIDCKYDEYNNRWDKTVTVEPVLIDELDLEVLGIIDDPNYSIQEPFPLIYDFKAPFELLLISGANQSAGVNSALADPVVVQVKDNMGEPVRYAKIWVDISGGGVLGQESLITDEEGKVYLNWTLGNNALDSQLLNIRVLNYDDSDIQGSPLIVNASFPPPLSLTYSGFCTFEQAVWNTPTTTLHASGGVPPYEYSFFENCDTWSTDSVINYPANGIVIDSCGNQNFLYGGQYAMRVRDAVGTMDTVLVFIDRERAVVNTTTTGCNVAPGATWLLYAGISITSPSACFDLQEGSTLSAWIFSSAIPDWWYGGGFGGGLGYLNNWNEIAGSETPLAGLKVDYGINGSCLTSYNTFVTFYTNNTAPTCPGASCSYRVRFFGPNATNAASPTRWIWSNVITHTW